MTKKTSLSRYNSSVLILLAVFALVVTLVSLGILDSEKNIRGVGTGNITREFSQDIEEVLRRKIALLETLASDQTLIAYVEEKGIENKTLKSEDILLLDEAWGTLSEDDPRIKNLFENSVSFLLKEFQDDNPEFPEIFISDNLGLNVALTNKTSDYYQADEDWWTEAFANGKGRSFHGEIEYDESAQSESIALYLPMYNRDRVAVGVMKAVLNVSVISDSL